MKTIICLILITSSIFADIPSAGRPDPGAFVDESIEALKKINERLLEINTKLSSSNIKEMDMQLIISAISKLSRFENEIIILNDRIGHLIWITDHPLQEEKY